ncbi:GRAM domain-containing protein [Russula compacta]|nr:GRAM domain-containing protein [Russula compacta]
MVKRSPALSGHHVATSQSSVDSNPLQLSPQAIRSRHNSLTARPQDHESDYASSADGHDEDGDDDDSEDDELLAELNDGDMPVTGFAVASNKRNADFHELFRTIPEGDYLIEDYGCALQREILVQGRIYISENHICFYANIFGWVTNLIVPIYDIVSLEKKMTAFVIPNAIQITTRTTKYAFASFLARDTAYDVIYNIWRLARPEDDLCEDENVGRPAMDASHALGNTSPNGSGTASTGSVLAPVPKVTSCVCGREGKHYTELALDAVFPGTPERIYNLMFASGFLKDFMRDDQKLEDIQISDWAPIPGDQNYLARNMSYIKRLNASIGPKTAKCEIRDETVYSDFDDFVTMVTTTRTPDVPSGGVFSVKTRTCITWASSASSRVVVTSQVEWTGRSFIRGIIEKSAIEGQRTYQRELDRAMRNYIQEHQTEFIPAGLDPAAVVAVTAQARGPSDSATSPTAAGAAATSASGRREKEREQERNRRGLQWAYDTFEGAHSVGRRSAHGAIELIRDAWDQSSTSTILYFVITFLVLSNLWTLVLVGQREEAGRRKEMRRTEERERWVQGIVTALWEELAAGRQPGAAQPPSPPPPLSPPWRQEVTELSGALDAVEERMRLIRQSLAELD